MRVSLTQPRVFLTVLVGASLLLTGFLIIDFWSYESARDKRSVELGREAGIRVAAALDAASALVMPSIWEGFGLPVVEAFGVDPVHFGVILILVIMIGYYRVAGLLAIVGGVLLLLRRRSSHGSPGRAA